MLEIKTLSPLIWTLVFCNEKTLFSNCQVLFSLMIFNELWYTLSFALFNFMDVAFFDNSKYSSEISLNETTAYQMIDCLKWTSQNANVFIICIIVEIIFFPFCIVANIVFSFNKFHSQHTLCTKRMYSVFK